MYEITAKYLYDTSRFCFNKFVNFKRCNFFKNKNMMRIISGIFIAIILLMIGSILYIESGSYDVSQLVPHNAITKWAINTTRRNSIKKRIKDIQVPGNLSDTALIIEGFKHYNGMCVGCHGAPGVDQWDMAEGLYPKPPKIYKSDEDMDRKEVFWIVKNGIKMTSMPGYGPTHTDDKVWAITAFVAGKLQKMSPDEYKAWQKKYGEVD
jgi:mono/diheme cytochrome c family protein